MKKLYIISILTIMVPLLAAQAPNSFKYQAIIRNTDGSVVANQELGLLISILQGSDTGSVIISENYNPTTNNYGLVNLELGSVHPIPFREIDWTDGPYFVKIEADVNGGTDYLEFGTSQLLSVPYAQHAKLADKANYYFETDPVYSNSLASKITPADTARWNSSSFSLTDTAKAGNLLTFDGNNWIAADLLITTNNTGSAIPINNMQPSLVLNYCIAVVGIFPSRNSADPLLGEIAIFPYTFNPRGWAYCDGQLLAISSNTALFSLLGTNFGGDGRTTFGLPDLRGRVAMHKGRGPGLTDRRLGQKFGTETNTITIANMPAHKHTVNISFED